MTCVFCKSISFFSLGNLSKFCSDHPYVLPDRLKQGKVSKLVDIYGDLIKLNQ